MRTALDIAMDRAEKAQPIPLITDPMGQGWTQPNRTEITLDETHAVMTRRTFNKLHEYSGSKPTGAYEGKMWKRHDGGFDFAWRAKGGKPVWMLCWYGVSTIGPGYVSNNHREILLIEDGSPDEGCSCCAKPSEVPA